MTCLNLTCQCLSKFSYASIDRRCIHKCETDSDCEGNSRCMTSICRGDSISINCAIDSDCKTPNMFCANLGTHNNYRCNWKDEVSYLKPCWLSTQCTGTDQHCSSSPGSLMPYGKCKCKKYLEFNKILGRCGRHCETYEDCPDGESCINSECAAEAVPESQWPFHPLWIPLIIVSALCLAHTAWTVYYHGCKKKGKEQQSLSTQIPSSLSTPMNEAPPTPIQMTIITDTPPRYSEIDLAEGGSSHQHEASPAAVTDKNFVPPELRTLGVPGAP